MKYFTITEILCAIVASSLYGAIGGCIYRSLSTLLSCIGRLLSVGIKVLKADKVDRYKDVSIGTSAAVSRLRSSVYDFAFLIIFGAGYIFLTYITLDGIQRLYVFIPCVAAFYISKRTIGALFEKTIVLICTAVYRILFFILYLLTYPIKVVCIFVYKLISPLIRRLAAFLNSGFLALRIKRKKKQLKDFFRSAPMI